MLAINPDMPPYSINRQLSITRTYVRVRNDLFDIFEDGHPFIRQNSTGGIDNRSLQPVSYRVKQLNEASSKKNFGFSEKIPRILTENNTVDMKQQHNLGSHPVCPTTNNTVEVFRSLDLSFSKAKEIIHINELNTQSNNANCFNMFDDNSLIAYKKQISEYEAINALIDGMTVKMTISHPGRAVLLRKVRMYARPDAQRIVITRKKGVSHILRLSDVIKIETSENSPIYDDTRNKLSHKALPQFPISFYFSTTAHPLVIWCYNEADKKHIGLAVNALIQID